jgi:hypothetical protein
MKCGLICKEIAQGTNRYVGVCWLGAADAGAGAGAGAGVGAGCWDKVRGGA